MSASFSGLRPTSTGSGQIRVPAAAGSPPSSRIASSERTRCCRYPIRPVTPLTTMPIDLRDIRRPSVSVGHDRRTEHGPDLAGQPGDRGIGHDLRVLPLGRQVDVEYPDDPARPGAEHDDAGTEE